MRRSFRAYSRLFVKRLSAFKGEASPLVSRQVQNLCERTAKAGPTSSPANLGSTGNSWQFYASVGATFLTAGWATYGLTELRFPEEHWNKLSKQASAAIADVPAKLLDVSHTLLPGSAAVQPSQRAPPPWGPYAIADAAAKAAPAVVNITVPHNIFPYSTGSTGSGFIFDPNGTILTNAHVVINTDRPLSLQPSRSHVSSREVMEGGSRRVIVTLQDGRVFDGRVVNMDTVTDLAVVKIDVDEPLPAVRLGCSTNLRVGEWVVALGSPLHLQNSVTAGIVSCVDRKAVELGLTDARTDYIQTDAAINRGNSGGPLVNLCGEVIGISNMKAIAADGVSFAIPIDTVKEVVAQLTQLGRVVRPYIGIKMLQLTPSNAMHLKKVDNRFPNVDAGILVPHVTPGSPAEKAGLQAGDVITGFAGQDHDVTTTNLIKTLGRHVGKSMELRVKRSDMTITLHITASEAAS